MENIRVDGIKEAERILSEIARSYPKQTVAAGLRAAAKPYVNKLKSSGPDPQFAKLAGVKAYTKGKEPLIAAGQFGGRNKRVWKTFDSYMSMYYISYWINHGTLANRSASYHFKNARKSKSAKWQGGIKATSDVAKAWEATKGQVIASIPVEMRKATEKYIKRMKSKGM